MKLSMVVACAGALAACGPSGGAAGGGAVAAGDATVASFAGEWAVSGHIVAPWFGPEGFAPEPDAEILGTKLTISETGVTGPAALMCAGATLAVAQQPLSAMFDGKVTDAYLAKAQLGVEGEQTAALTGCNAQTYYMIGEKKMLLGVNDIIYQFGPPKAEEPAPAAATPAPAEAPKP